MTAKEQKELGDLLFPNTKQTIADLLKEYPLRELPPGAEVLRFAPSPTGYLHLGSFYSAFIQFLAARRTHGVFYLRLEDTDQKREIQGAGDILYKSLIDYGVVPDEGYRGDKLTEQGKYGPYVQSKRIELYNVFAKHLIENGNAFPCFCAKTENKSEIIKRREQEIANNDEIREKDVCRDLSFDELKTKIAQGLPFAIRLKSKGDGTKTREVTDIFKGKREVRENAKDIILLKSNGIPPYAFAHLVDDTLMRTTKVIRGEDWYSSLAAHIELFEAAGFQPLQYGHTPVISTVDSATGNKRKLSKRYDPQADMRFYEQAGYPKQAVLEYILTIANSDFESWRSKNPGTHIYEFPFSLAKVGNSNPMFDWNKLNDISKNIIAKMTCKQINKEVTGYFTGTGKMSAEDFTKMYAILAIDRETPKPRKDIVKYSDIPELYSYIFREPVKSLPLISPKAVHEYAKAYQHSDSKEQWFARIKNECEKNGYSVKDYTRDIRVALTGRENTPDLYVIMQILGNTEVLKRLQKT